MPRLLFGLLLLCVALCALLPLQPREDVVRIAQAQQDQTVEMIQDIHTFDRAPGGYLSWYKLALIAIVFLVWVRACEWVNKDAQKTTLVTRLKAENWNPLMVFPFVGSFVLVLFIPFFWIGFPIYLAAAVVPFFVYVRTRNKLVETGDTAFTRAHFKRKRAGITGSAAEIQLKQDQGPDFAFTPAGNSDMERKTNLIRARQGEGYVTLKGVMSETVTRRSDQLAINYTRETVTLRCEVDGVWNDLPALDRSSGDAMLISLKFLAGLNPQERRAKQNGSFRAANRNDSFHIQLITQGVPTGEQVIVRLTSSKQKELAISDLGLSPQLLESLKQSVNQPGLTVVTAPAGHGLTTSWQAALEFSDRLTRDVVALVDFEERETEFENVEQIRFDANNPDSFIDQLRQLDLREIDALIVPKITNGKALDMLLSHVEKGRSVITRMRSNSSTEALLALLSSSGERRKCLESIKAVICQRLVRRLCTVCRIPLMPSSQQIQQLGGNPNLQYSLFGPYQRPVQPMLDDKGNPVEVPTCANCAGIGYVGRIGAFEFLEVGDDLEKAVIKSPKADLVQASAQRMGHLTTLQACYQHVLNGITSVQEVQRVFATRS